MNSFYDLFDKIIELNGIAVNKDEVKHTLEKHKDNLLKIERIPTIINLNKGYNGIQLLTKHSSSHIVLVNKKDKNTEDVKLKMNYKFFNSHEILSNFLSNPPTSFETVGDVIHLNLKDEFLSYKYLIGKVLHDKTSLLVINKLGNINNTFRNFDFEIIGDSWLDFDKLKNLSKLKERVVVKEDKTFRINYKEPTEKGVSLEIESALLSTKKDKFKEVLTFLSGLLVQEILIDTLETVHYENGLKFIIDIKNYYWCSKLQGERQLLLRELKKEEVFCDLFCGVGPMVLPALKKGCSVVCNDLNPSAVNCLRKSIAKNKLETAKVQIYNLDAVKFIDKIKNIKVDHFFLNLPEQSLKYLKYLKSFRHNFKVHCYFFCNDNWNVIDFIHQITGQHFEETQVTFVRKVSPSKNMFKLTYTAQ